MFRLIILLLFIFSVTLTASSPSRRESGTATSTAKSHPGCAVWWFLNDCPLGNLFGVDPFGIYPWKKFCKKYSGLRNTSQCKKLKIKETNKDKEIIELNNEEIEEVEGIGPRNNKLERVKRYGRQEQEQLFPNHPGCMHFWFLPGCPLGFFGTDPFQRYPWEKLCQFKDLSQVDRCKPIRLMFRH